MTTDITAIHHLGHVVENMPAALELYRRLGFTMTAPSYPALPHATGEQPRPIGAGNCHADFADNFIELVAVADENAIPDDARLIPLEVPEAARDQVLAAVRGTAANLSDCLARFEGTHILMFGAPDIEVTGARLSDADTGHGGIRTVQRPVEGGTVPVSYLEIDYAGLPAGRVPEGRVGVVGAPESPLSPVGAGHHPNTAVAVVDTVLCVDAPELDDVVDRYRRYLDREPQRLESGAVFALDTATVTVVTPTGLDALLPGEKPAAVPGFAAVTVAVADLDAAREVLRDNGFAVNRSSRGDMFVPAHAALGTAIAFTAAHG